jgi:acetyl esterase/lipase
VTLNQIVEDAFGAVLWVKDNVGHYRGDPSRIAVTGDSAGGHLSAMIVNMGDRLNSGIFSGEGPGLRLTVDAASFAKLDVERVGQAVFGQSLRQNANDVVQFHGDGRLYFTPG